MTYYRGRAVVLALLVCSAMTIQARLAYAQGTPTGVQGFDAGAWFQQNLLAVAILVFHFGVSWREFLDHRRRIVRLEDDMPKTYVRKDVLDVRLDGIDEELKEWRESFSFLRRRADRRGGVPHER